MNEIREALLECQYGVVMDRKTATEPARCILGCHLHGDYHDHGSGFETASPKLICWKFCTSVDDVIHTLFNCLDYRHKARGSGPVVVYATVFVMINIAFLGYQQEALSQARDIEARLMRVRTLITPAIFVTAGCVAH